MIGCPDNKVESRIINFNSPISSSISISFKKEKIFFLGDSFKESSNLGDYIAGLWEGDGHNIYQKKKVIHKFV